MRIAVKRAERAGQWVIVTAAGRENLILRTLVRQAIPMLQNSEAHSPAERRRFVQTLQMALGGGDDKGEGVSPHGDGSAPFQIEGEPSCLPDEVER